MGGENDGAAAQAQVAGEPQALGDQTAVTAGLKGAGDVGGRRQRGREGARGLRGGAQGARRAHRGAGGEIAEATKTAEGAEALRRKMDELRRKGDEERVGFELQLAGARNVKAARGLPPDYDNDIDKLRPRSRGSSARGLPPLRRWARQGCRMRARPPTRARR